MPTIDKQSTVDKAVRLRQLHTDPELLVLVNVWDVVSATVVAGQPGCTAIATASHSIAAAHGYPDGQQISAEEMLDAVGRIAAAVDLPVTADLEAGYGDPATTTRRAIGLGVVGANIEDQMQPLPVAVRAVEQVVRTAEAEGVPFVLNARTDAFLLAGDRDPGDVLADAIERGRAFLAAGAACVFVPGRLDEATLVRLVEGIGRNKVSVLALPGTPEHAVLAELGVARVSYGPQPQGAAMAALATLAGELLRPSSLGPSSLRSSSRRPT